MHRSITVHAVFSPFTVSLGPGVPITDRRRNCQLNIDLSYPSTLQYGAISTTFSGTVSLEANAVVNLRSTYYFSGETKQVSPSTALEGPKTGDYSLVLPVEDPSVADQDILWSRCGDGLPLNINRSLRISSLDTVAHLSKLQDDGTFVVTLEFRECVA
ncbi:hypothetical protein B0O99DRAFT_515351 [Bisporella sp. PMI_857]|nr:hypothetical protein B0O99DRAFT_515351 [Bisporella sp. PMI_857]